MSQRQRLRSPQSAALVRAALAEDLGRGDITSRAVLPAGARIRARIAANSPGVLAGGAVAAAAFRLLDRSIRCRPLLPDGAALRAGAAILLLDGPAGAIFAAERTALNLLGHLSGIATLTRAFVRAVPGRVAILDTRKTLPGLRTLEKYAVRCGGGRNHRRGLDEAVLIKTPHLAVLRRRLPRGGSAVTEALRLAKARAPGRFLEIEVSTRAELEAALRAGPHAILLDNWPLRGIRQAVRIRNASGRSGRRVMLEASGGITLRRVARFGRTGIDRISIGRLTHSAPALDCSLTVVEALNP
ncbi:MAG TPA: carboxylating nicotinate-nucleotide diphosphorylase [bacterium]